MLFLGGGKSNSGSTTANGYDQSGTGHAQGSVTVAGGIVTSVSLSTAAGTNTGYTEQPYVYLLHGAGAGSFITNTFANVSVTGVLLSGTAAPYTRFLRFGGSGISTNRDRFVVLKSQDTTAVNYLSLIHI